MVVVPTFDRRASTLLQHEIFCETPSVCSTQASNEFTNQYFMKLADFLITSVPFSQDELNDILYHFEKEYAQKKSGVNKRRSGLQ